ncbi:cyclin-dependent protein kinase-activating kinase CAK1 [Cyberlindnera jadinii NRRL Y-1542]|uniref:Kinase-like protein n=1 Tax=Cyberlindnera jadinii (strain ATCC 18201 / CBS 1600 / BCRC 20928 / JCM 3617 / NBRC 0987 / NRRL Y-1542) TaxID=983966 RepID=A0A1E4RXM9_CYBJN|nr:kinase-like protein [Cyberlindnera jadinii NRRL Y-1542]ODV72042.1 kinase-like protein [Cyberlindnera jadinii NRRL Y-1542]
MNNYKERKRIKCTRFSDVYSAICAKTNLQVAIKVVCTDDERPPHCSRDEVRLLKQFAQEKAPANITTLLDVFTEDLTDTAMVFPYYAFTLTSWLRRHAKRTKASHFNPYINVDSRPTTAEYISSLTLEEGVEIIKGVANGLDFLHGLGVIHRDIKPDNIMFQGYNPTPVIIDFGISYKIPNNFGKESDSNKICDIGTGIYKAPELLFHIADYGYGVDIWALGIVMTLVFSKDLKPVFEDEDIVDFKLMGMIFSTFGTPSLEIWPEAAKSTTFERLQLLPHPGKPMEQILPGVDNQIRKVFQKMMTYESKERISAKEIYTLLS